MEKAEAAAKALALDYNLEKVTDIREIIKRGVMATPALVVDGKVKAAGRAPSVEEIKAILAADRRGNE
jgi:small redox-active disulfide protein 2